MTNKDPETTVKQAIDLFISSDRKGTCGMTITDISAIPGYVDMDGIEMPPKWAAFIIEGLNRECQERESKIAARLEKLKKSFKST